MTLLMVVLSHSLSHRQSLHSLTGLLLEWVAPGKKSERSVAQFINDEGTEYVCVDVGARSLFVLGAQFVDVKDALEALEVDLDLPAQPV